MVYEPTDPCVVCLPLCHESSQIFRTDVRCTSSSLKSGIAKGSRPFDWGAGLCPASLSPRVADGDARKRFFCGDTPHPGRDAALPAPSLSEFLFQKFGMTHDLNITHICETLVALREAKPAQIVLPIGARNDHQQR